MKVQEELTALAEQIQKTLAKWESHRVNGCVDPIWPDGVGMNNLRNHIVYYKMKMKEICGQSVCLPEEYFLPLPPYTDANYFAKPESERAIRIKRIYSPCANTEKVNNKLIENEQLVLF